MRPGRSFIAFFAILMLVWIVQTMLADFREERTPIDEIVSERRAEMEQQAAARTNGTSSRLWVTDGGDYGWPTLIIRWYDAQRWEFAPGREPRPVAQGSSTRFKARKTRLVWNRILDDPSRDRTIEFHWLAALEEIMVLQFVALLFTGIVYGLSTHRVRVAK